MLQGISCFPDDLDNDIPHGIVLDPLAMFIPFLSTLDSGNLLFFFVRILRFHRGA